MYTVKELIEALQQCPEDYAVMVNYMEHLWNGIVSVGIDHEEKTVDLFTE